MTVPHFEFLVEEPSMEAFLNAILPGFLKDRATYAIHNYRSKDNLLRKLKERLRGYACNLDPRTRIIVLIDRDNDDCSVLKQKLETCAADAGLTTRSRQQDTWQVANRIVIEELEAWFFGEWSAVLKAYPKVSPSTPKTSKCRSSDAIKGGTWEVFEKKLQNAGYFSNGLRKVDAAREIGRHFTPASCISPSFTTFRDVLVEALG